MRPRRPRLLAVSACVTVALTLSACGGDDDESASSTPAGVSGDSVTDVSLVEATQPSVPEVKLPESTPTELVTTEITPGTGEPAKAGDTVLVNYVGVRSEDGTQFDHNFGSEPFPVTLGTGSVIAGWDQGLVGARTGERLQLDIPADLAYGDQPRGEIIKAGDALSFVVDVLAVLPVGDPAAAPTDIPTSTDTISEAAFEDVRTGDGATLAVGDAGIFQLVVARGDTGEVLNSTWVDGGAQMVTIEEGQLPDELFATLPGMKVGGRRVITIPAAAATELQPPANAVFVADLVGIAPAS